MRLSPCCTESAQNLDGLARRVLHLHAGVLDQIDPRRGAAVHDGHFGVVELDETLSMPRQRSADSRCSTVSTDASPDEAGLKLLTPPRYETCAGISMPPGRRAESECRNLRAPDQGKSDLLSGMKSDPGAVTGATKGALRRHLVHTGTSIASGLPTRAARRYST